MGDRLLRVDGGYWLVGIDVELRVEGAGGCAQWRAWRRGRRGE